MLIKKLLLNVSVLTAAVTIPVVGMTETLRYNTFMPPLSVESKGIKEFFKEVEDATDGNVKGRIFVGGQLLGGQATLSGIRDGVVDAGFIVPTLNSSEIPHVAMLPELLPFSGDFWAATGATNETMMLGCDECKQDLSNYNAVWLGGIGASPWYMMCREPINSMDDLRGKTVRVTGGFAARMTKALGASSVALPASEIPSAMQQGMIDCAVGTLSWLNTLGLSDIVKGIVDEPIGSYHGLGQLVFNRDSLNKLKKEDRAAVIKLIPHHLAMLSANYSKDEQAARDTAAAKGISMWKPGNQFHEIMKNFREGEIKSVAEDIQSQGGSVDAESIVKNHIEALNRWQQFAKEANGDPDAFAAILEREIYSKISLDNL